LLNPANFFAGLQTEAGVEVGTAHRGAEPGIFDEGPGDRDPLLLAAGELIEGFRSRKARSERFSPFPGRFYRSHLW
jgi:hypothetical protein